MAYDGSVSHDIFVTAGNQVFAIDPTADRIVENATVGNGANGMAIDPQSGRLFVAEYPDAEIFVFQLQSLSPLSVIPLPSCCASQVAVDSRTHLLFATTRTGFVDVVNMQSDRFVNSLKVATTFENSTNLVVVDNDTGRAFVSSSPGGSIAELDGSGGAIIGWLRAGSQVAGMAIDYRTHELYSTNYHQVTVFDISRPHLLFFALVLAAAALAAVAVVVLVVINRNRRANG
jgi:DNA-binding beta-propeller fold protein YncE